MADNQRQIKFRAWDKTRQEFLDPTYNNVRLSELFTLPFYEFQQFTGLHDSAGVEIFEGDIVQSQAFRTRPHSSKCKEKRFVGEVYYHIGEGTFGDNTHKQYSAEWAVRYPDTGEYRHYDWGDLFDVTVIGNLHQHPHLLTEAK